MAARRGRATAPPSKLACGRRCHPGRIWRPGPGGPATGASGRGADRPHHGRPGRDGPAGHAAGRRPRRPGRHAVTRRRRSAGRTGRRPRAGAGRSPASAPARTAPVGDRAPLCAAEGLDAGRRPEQPRPPVPPQPGPRRGPAVCATWPGATWCPCWPARPSCWPTTPTSSKRCPPSIDPTDARQLAAAPRPLARRAVRRWLRSAGAPRRRASAIRRRPARWPGSWPVAGGRSGPASSPAAAGSSATAGGCAVAGR